MMPPRRILHPTDFSATALMALAHAAVLARRFEAALHVLHVTPTFGEDPLRGAFQAATDEAAFYRHVRDEADRLMRRTVKIAAGGVPAKRVHTRSPAPAEAVVQYAASEAIDLIAIGTHGRRGARRLMMGSVAEEVVRRAPCGVLSVRGDAKPLKLRRVLVPVDLDEAAGGLLDQAARLAAISEARLDALHVLDLLPAAFGAKVEGLTLPAFTARIKAHARKKLKELLQSAKRPGVLMEGQLREGRPASVIAQVAAETDPDLILMATRGLEGIERLLLGSVTERVLRRAPCPVWTVRLASAVAARPATEEAAPARTSSET